MALLHPCVQVAKQQGEYLAGLLGKGACKPGQPMDGVKGFRRGLSSRCLWYLVAASSARDALQMSFRALDVVLSR